MLKEIKVVELKGAKLIGLINFVAALLHLLFWALALFHFAPTLSSPMSASVATTLGIGVADLLLAVPLLLMGSFGLFRGKASAWLAAQMAHVLYFYSMTFVLIRDFLVGEYSPGTFVFLPFTFFAIWATFYLWKNKGEFMGSSKSL